MCSLPVWFGLVVASESWCAFPEFGPFLINCCGLADLLGQDERDVEELGSTSDTLSPKNHFIIRNLKVGTYWLKNA